MDQQDLFSQPMPERVGRARITDSPTSQILASASGFMDDYDYTLNPYTGCGFGCAYCYAAFFVRTAELREDWGNWVQVKSNAENELRRKRPSTTFDKKIYMSSVTDPYQPVEMKTELTRRILEILREPERRPRLVVQTRSPFVTRDLDLYKGWGPLRINMTISTDSENVRKRFEPTCPGIDRRFAAIEEVARAGIRTTVCITPMLPIENVSAFVRRIRDVGPAWVVTQPFKASNGPFAASTRTIATDIAKEYGWTLDDYHAVLVELRRMIPDLRVGKEGFVPE